MVVLVGCSSKSRGGSDQGPSIADLDRVCAQDVDCQVITTLACCSASCGEQLGEAYSTRSILKASAGREGRCRDVQCEDMMCQALPQCRDEAHAVCRSGRCEVERRPTEACAAAGLEPEEACRNSGDCVVYVKPDCCAPCPSGPPWRIVNRLTIDREREALRCDGITCPAHSECIAVGMPALDCVAGRCVAKP